MKSNQILTALTLLVALLATFVPAWDFRLLDFGSRGIGLS